MSRYLPIQSLPDRHATRGDGLKGKASLLFPQVLSGPPVTPLEHQELYAWTVILTPPRMAFMERYSNVMPAFQETTMENSHFY